MSRLHAGEVQSTHVHAFQILGLLMQPTGQLTIDAATVKS
jgi:hypothetical protein